jgi:putative phosphoesterase
VRVAALYDVHGMIHALDAVLAEVETERPDAIVLGGDIAAGPFPRETLQRVRALDACCIRGNGDRQGVDWPGAEWLWRQLDADAAAWLQALPFSLVLDDVLYVHATPRSDTEIVTERTPDERLVEALAGVEQPLVVAGHTHMTLDRRAGGVRFVNPGSVGMPYEGDTDARWAVVDGGEVELRRTPIDAEAARAAVLATSWPDAEDFANDNLVGGVPRSAALDAFASRS